MYTDNAPMAIASIHYDLAAIERAPTEPFYRLSLVANPDPLDGVSDHFAFYEMGVDVAANPIAMVQFLYDHAPDFEIMSDESESLDALTDLLCGFAGARETLHAKSSHLLDTSLHAYANGDISQGAYQDTINQVEAASAAFESLVGYITESVTHKSAFEHGKDLLDFYSSLNAELATYLLDDVSELEYTQIHDHIERYSVEDVEGNEFLQPERRDDLVDELERSA